MFFYTCAYTSQGFWDFTKENIFDVATSVSLNCTNPYVTDWVLTGFAKELKEEYHTIIAPGTGELKSGLVLKNRQRAFVANCSHATEQLELDKYFNLSTLCKKSQRHWSDMEISYKKAKLVHDEWERVYINNMDFKSLDSFSQKVIKTLTAEESQEGKGKVYRRFFGTTTVEGTVNFIDDITESIRKRYFIKGRPGTGKSTFLKKLSKALTEKGYDVEEYYCSFDPKSLDMVVSRELSFCVFDSTPPHEKFPERDTDEILDFYREAGLEGIDEKYRNELREIKKAYDTLIKSGVKAFKEAVSIENKEYAKQFEKVKNNADIKLLF